MHPAWIIAFILFDVIVTATVVVVIIGRRGGIAGAIGFDPKAAMSVSRDLEAEAETYLRANWNGDRDTLPEALNELLKRFESRLAAEHMPLERAQLKPLVLRIVEAKHLAETRDAREAMKKVA